ncbi:MAG TPA: PAS domain-containing protein [Thermoanaerobaculia bacterium]
MVWLSDRGGNCEFVNERWLEYTGGLLEDQLGRGWTRNMHPDDVAPAAAIVGPAFEKRAPFRVEYRLRRHDGVYRWFAAVGNPRFVDGQFDGYAGSALDVDDMKAIAEERRQFAAAMTEQRERLANIVSSVPGVVWEAWGAPDRDSNRIDFVSDHVERMLGYTVEEWLSTPNFWLVIVHPDDRQQAAAAAAEHFAKGGNGTNAFRWVAKDGRVLWVESQAAVIADDAGNPIGMRGVTMDVTARRRAEESIRFLAKASELLSSSLDYETTLKATAQLATSVIADFAIIDLFDEQGTIHRLATVHTDPRMQPVVEKLLAYPPVAGGKSAMASALQRQAPVVAQITDDVLQRNARNAEHLAVMRELAPRCFITVPMVARDHILGTLTFMSTTMDQFAESDVELAKLLARRAAIAIDNAQLYRAAVEASRAKDEFLATVSHELRTPMTATLGWVRMIALGHVEPAMHKVAMEAIERSTRAQARLIDDILDVSSIIMGKFRLDMAAVDLPQVIEQTIETVRPATEAKSIALRVDTSGWSGMVRGDANRVQQIVWNLVSNAIKFGRQDGSIAVTLTRNDGFAQIEVSDDGQGIDPGFLPFVFDRFRQADGGAKRQHGGLGLGLAIVRHLAELHGGTVRATSEGHDRGATFIVELPIVDETSRTPAHDAASIRLASENPFPLSSRPPT